MTERQLLQEAARKDLPILLEALLKKHKALDEPQPEAENEETAE